VQYAQDAVRIQLGDTLLMDKGQPLPFDEKAASAYLRSRAEVHGTVNVQVPGAGW
jgi:glutamate N-acetyltransferase/amino-acid N-acetyltransferase